MKLLLSFLLLIYYFNISFAQDDKQIIYLKLDYVTDYRFEFNRSLVYILDFKSNRTDRNVYPSRVGVASTGVTVERPLFITASQQEGVSSWQLPMIVGTPTSTVYLMSMFRTLCQQRDNTNATQEDTTTTVTLSTTSDTNISVTIQLEKETNFFIQLNEEKELVITPNAPRYFYFSFDNSNGTEPNVTDDLTTSDLKGEGARLSSVYREAPALVERFTYKIPRSVIVTIESSDDVCALVSIQNSNCPTFDNERDILYEGYYLTMMKKGGITLTQSMFPKGFHLVFIVKESDHDCVGTDSVSGLGYPDTRTKRLKFKIVETISYREYVIAASLAFCFFISFYFIAMLVILVCDKKHGRTMHVVNVECDLAAPGSSSQPLVNDDGSSLASSDSRSEYSLVDKNDIDSLPNVLTLALLAKKSETTISGRAHRYLWHLTTVSVFYALPVVQLVITYQSILNDTGNQDLCYYNFLCAHPLGFLSDFNHVYSNLGYILLGALFLILVRRRHARARLKKQINKGIPQHFGLFYSMGLALIMEGVMSGSYHICPNHMNFQFDSSFMYVIAVLCILKIYQTRHPDINARAHATFMLLALIIFIGLVGVLNSSLYFWIGFTALHIVASLVLTVQIYYVGRFKFSGILKRAALEIRRSRCWAFWPDYKARMLMLILANIANWLLAAYGVYEHKKDFAVHLLAILMGNTILYTLFYIVMKVVHRERITAHAWFFILTANVAWFSSLHFFLTSRTKWSLTPAQSRRFNHQCDMLEFYDLHDIWHFVSAVAMFLSFNLLLTLDDGLGDTPREQIMVF